MDESRVVALLSETLSNEDPRVLVGIGDDAAVLQPTPGRQLVVSNDCSVEHQHFERAWLSLADIGYRAISSAVSDIVAMGAQPLGALVHLSLPVPTLDGEEITALARGQQAAAVDHGCPIVGGNLSRAPVLELVVTVFGECVRPVLRSGAQPGDELWLIGEVGLAALGLDLLRGRGSSRRRGAERAIETWRRPRALVDQAEVLASSANAAIDVSDGLAGDARHLAEASGVQLVIEEVALRASLESELVNVAGSEPELRDPLDYALYGGEDYAVLATGPAEQRPPGVQRVGVVCEGSGVELERPAGKRVAVAKGYDHLR